MSMEMDKRKNQAERTPAMSDTGSKGGKSGEKPDAFKEMTGPKIDRASEQKEIKKNATEQGSKTRDEKVWKKS